MKKIVRLFLLAGLATTASSVVALPADTGEQHARQLARDALGVLEAACYRCHGKDASRKGGLDFILKPGRLVDSEYIVRGKPEQSLLYRYVADGTMPPPGEAPRPSKAEVGVLRRWIAVGAPEVGGSRPREFVSNQMIVQIILDDLLRRSESQRRFVRYLHLAPLVNSGVSDEHLQAVRHALGRVINYVSSRREVVAPRSVDPAQVVFAVDIRDLGWTSRTWEAIERRDIYALALATPQAQKIAELTSCKMPFARADWFVREASRAPLYYTLLGLPETLAELERRLQVDVAENLRQFVAARAGLGRSGVSQNNRIVEFHPSPHGYYTRSYDFGSSTGRQNIFLRPLGPGDDTELFAPQGGEVIFSLPNGFTGFYIHDAEGKRLDEAPVGIVTDPKQPDKTVRVGVSCMHCHRQGLLRARDAIRSHVKANLAAYPRAADILSLYREQAESDRLVDAGRRQLEEALAKLGQRQAGRDPIHETARQFESDVDFGAAAAEFGLQRGDFSAALSKLALRVEKEAHTNSATVTQVLGTFNVTGATISREAFDRVFLDAAQHFGLGVPIHKRDDEPKTPASVTVTINSITAKSRKADGKSWWDALAGKPDPFLVVLVDSVEVERTSPTRESLTISPRLTFACPEGADIRIIVWDADVSEHDLIGNVQFVARKALKVASGIGQIDRCDIEVSNKKK